MTIIVNLLSGYPYLNTSQIAMLRIDSYVIKFVFINV